MKKTISILLGASLFLATSAYSAGMVGVKFGLGELDATNNSYTAGSTTVASQSASKDNQFGAIFGELELPALEGLSLGVEYVPFEANIRLDKGESGTGAEVSDATTIYASIMRDAGAGSVYAKVGYFTADIGAVTNANGTTVNSQDDTLEGPMLGIGFQQELMNGIFGRLEGTYTELDDVSITTTSNGSSSVKKTGSGDITTITLSVAKSF